MLIDSNLLIYAINSASPKHKKAQEFLKSNLGNLDISHQNILETVRVLTHKKFSKSMTLKPALEAVLAIANSCRLISPNQTTYFLTLELIKTHELIGNRIFDAYLAACALSNNVSTIATDNISDFRKFKQLKLINPFS